VLKKPEREDMQSYKARLFAIVDELMALRNLGEEGARSELRSWVPTRLPSQYDADSICDRLFHFGRQSVGSR
jgi:hypothetical protein